MYSPGLFSSYLLTGVSAIFWLSINSDGFFDRSDVILSVDVDPSPKKGENIRFITAQKLMLMVQTVVGYHSKKYKGKSFNDDAEKYLKKTSSLQYILRFQILYSQHPKTILFGYTDQQYVS